MMKIRKNWKCICLLSIIFVLSSCSKAAVSDNVALDVLAPESELTITSSKAKAFEFSAPNDVILYDTDECYNITPDFVADNSDFSIFKYDQSTESFIMYDKNAYHIGRCFGGWDGAGIWYNVDRHYTRPNGHKCTIIALQLWYNEYGSCGHKHGWAI